jgi:hypothetical protein
MAISPTEIRWYLSSPNASTGYSQIGTPGNSLGKWMSTTQVSGVPVDDLFLDLNPAQNVSLQVDYQCVFLANFTVTIDSMRNPYVWMPSQYYTFGGANLFLAVDPIGPLPYNSPLQQAQAINSNTTMPSVVGWYGVSPTYNPGGLLVPDIPPGYAVAVWIQRTATNSPALTPQSLSLQVTFASDA